MSNSYGIPDESVNLVSIDGYINAEGRLVLTNKDISSPDFDGYIQQITASIVVSDAISGQSLEVDGSFFPITYISRQDAEISGSAYTGEHILYYLDGDEEKSVTYSSSNTQIAILKEDWNNKYLGTKGWIITQEGNVIFTNIAARGRIEATSGFIGGTEFGWEIDQNLIKNASVGFYAPEVTTGEIAFFAGSSFQDRASAAFRVGYDGSVNASSATIRGNLTATTLDVGGANGIIYNGSAVTIGASVNILAPVTVNALQVGASPTLLRIANDVNGTNDGIYINDNNYWYSDGQFGVGGSANNVVWDNSALTVTGAINATNITASTGSIAGFTLSRNELFTASIIISSSGGFRLGNPTVFSVDQFGNLVATTASITGKINATSGSFSGDITASAGRFVGAVSVSSSGAIYAGNSVDSGQRTVLNASGLFGYHSNGLEAFALPVSGSPRIGAFTVVPTGIVSQSASNANMVYGNVDSSGNVTDGIVIRGFRSAATGSAAIYNVQNGVATEFLGGGNGFYIDENARFKLKGATGSLSFDGNDLSIDGNINARSGRFTGSVAAQHITASTGSIGGWGLTASTIFSQVDGRSLRLQSDGSIVVQGTTLFNISASSPTYVMWTGGDPTNSQFALSYVGVLQTQNSEFKSPIITSGSFQGRISASSGDIAGFVMSASSLTYQNFQITIGDNSISTSGVDSLGAPASFLLRKNGTMVATNASVTGNLTAKGDFSVDTNVLYVNSLTNKVGINEISPTSVLDVVGDAHISASLLIGGVGFASSALHVVGSTLITNNLNVDAGTLYVDATNNEVGVLTTTPASALHVAGGLLVNNNASVGGTIFGNLSGNASTASSINASLITGTTLPAAIVSSSLTGLGTLTNLRVSGSISVDSGTLHVDPTNNRVGIGLVNPNTTLAVLGTASITSTLGIGGAITAGGNITMSQSGNFVPQLIIRNTNSLDNAGYLLFEKSFGASASATAIDLGTIMFKGPDINGTAQNSAYIVAETAAVSAANGTPSDLEFYTGNSTGTPTFGMILTSTQRLGIGTSNPNQTLTVVGTASITGNATFGANITLGTSSANTEVRSQPIFDTLTTNAATVQVATAGNNYRLQRSTASSRRWKNSIEDMPSAIQQIMNLRPVTFKFNEGYIKETDSRYNLTVPGLIAEEVAEAIPIAAERDENGPSDWNIRMLFPMLVKAVQEQQKEIIELRSIINNINKEGHEND